MCKKARGFIPRAFFMRQSDGGGAVVKMLPSKTPAEVFIFGATHVNAAPEDYLKFAFDMDRLRSLPIYLGVRRFGNPPTLSDLEGFTLEPDDIKNLKKCRPGAPSHISPRDGRAFSSLAALGGGLPRGVS